MFELVKESGVKRIQIYVGPISCAIEVFPKWSRTFIEFTEFSESEKSLKHELGSV